MRINQISPVDAELLLLRVAKIHALPQGPYDLLDDHDILNVPFDVHCLEHGEDLDTMLIFRTPTRNYEQRPR